MFRDLLRHRVSRAAQAAAVALSFLFIFAIVALAQDRQTQGSFAQDHRQNAPGQFDFYGPAMLRAAVFLRGAWALAAIRAGVPVLLPGAGAAARPQYRRQRAGPDAEPAADLP